MKNTMRLVLYGIASLLATGLCAQNVGIGTASPAEKLDVNGNLRFEGALMPAGNAGTSGEVLVSGGSNTAPSWSSATSGQFISTVWTTDTMEVPYYNTTVYKLVEGLTQTCTIPSTGTYDLWIYTDGGAQFLSGSSNKGAQLELSVWMDGVVQRYTTMMVDNLSNLVSGIRNWNIGFSISNIPAGTHTIEVYARHRTNGEPSIVVGAANVVGNYMTGTLTLTAVRK